MLVIFFAASYETHSDARLPAVKKMSTQNFGVICLRSQEVGQLKKMSKAKTYWYSHASSTLVISP
ncbi:hypothetical protein M378DRAFT_167515 [Amanita muscaria Koide BX008]|uniref:Uncharacterized protein n=1 Tax=Amanita muscaria (strain Koide BX008) TaxID=946122 RepID=A0A0C2T3F6_AMAMK|nr:hypothetical protein M378DRAFT_167515 [Amanita muscaria Koide BX008]